MWLYLTGHRQGDLRRMARVYHRDPMGLYPKGAYSVQLFSPNFTRAPLNPPPQYGSDVVFRPGADEQTYNPLYGGCYDLES